MSCQRTNSWWLVLVLPLLLFAAPSFAALSAQPGSLSLAPGATATVQILNASGRLRLGSYNSQIVEAQLSGSTLSVQAKSTGNVTLVIQGKTASVSIPVAVTATQTTSGSGSGSGSATAKLSALPSSLALVVGQSGKVAISNAVGRVRVTVANSSVVSASLSGTSLTVTAKAAGSTQISVRDQRSSVVINASVSKAVPPPVTNSDFKLLAWNNLGMHCMDSDYSVFSILPPYNVLHAQLVNAVTNSLVTSGVTVTFEAMADPLGSINSISSSKTNFWQYAEPLYGVSLAPDMGLAGYATASFAPQTLALDAPYSQFAAEGIPITPFDDAMQKNTYPMVKVVARDTAGNKLAEAHVVLPVSDEMTCIACHGSNAGPAAKPLAGWVYDANPDRDYRRNILRLHDEKQLGDAVFVSALASKGFSASGLLATADSGKPILCAACHSSNALPGTGITGIKPMTEAMHARHATVNDPALGLALDDINSRNSCYLCHPGSQTKCLRGVMGNAVLADGSMAIQCQSCHGGMSSVGRSGRAGWLEEPNCQACHHDGLRDLVAVDNLGQVKTTTDTRFATNPNVPASGISLYRFSKGHGNLQCEACHGATHAEYPSSHPNDNILSKDVQSHEGTVAECTACHKTVPLTANGGPHGMHTTGSTWVSSHEHYAEGNQQACAYCHGADYKGSPLSQVKVAKTLNGKSYTAGQAVSCYDCHNGPNGGD